MEPKRDSGLRSPAAAGRRAALVVALILAGLVALVGCAAGSGTNPFQDETVRGSGQGGGSTEGIAGKWVTAGPYQVKLREASIVSTATASAANVAVPQIPTGSRLVRAVLVVRAPQDGNAVAAPAHGMHAFQLLDSRGKSQRIESIGQSRSAPATQGPGPTATEAPLQPGDTFTLEPSFIVPDDVSGLKLLYRPDSSDPELVLEYPIR